MAFSVDGAPRFHLHALHPRYPRDVHPLDRLRLAVARDLERPSADASTLRRALAALWSRAAARSLRRPVALPPGLAVVGVGGAVLGGSGKTPLAVALAAAFAASGARVAFIGHAYRARPGCPRVLTGDEPLHVAGDDALAAARLLRALHLPVLVAPRREAALALAAKLGFEVAIVDGLLQTSPRPLTDAVLVLDAAAPWGGGACPPAGDLRAPATALLDVADHVVALGRAGAPADPSLPPTALRLETFVDQALDVAGAPIPLASLAGSPVGLLLAIARPERVLDALAARGVHPDPVVCLPDHARFSAFVLARGSRASVTAWLTTAKCAEKLPVRLGEAPVLVLDHRIDARPLLERLAAAGDVAAPSRPASALC